MKKNIYTTLSHLATWIVLFLLPMTFEELRFPLILIPTAGIIAIFYANYLWLTPNYYMKGRKAVCWIGNTIIIVVLSLALYFWLDVGLFYYFNLAVAAMIANAMRMAIYWQEAEEARLTAEAAKTTAELNNLRYQTNPHFLLNTLNNIYALTTFDVPRAQEAIQQLSGMLRQMLYDNTEKDVLLEDEVKFLENYISLMRIRLIDNVDVTFDKEVKEAGLRIAPLILIPLIENGFKHGISTTKPSFIHIKLTADKERITFLIENSNYPKNDNDQSGHGIGLVQVQKRLDLTYPGKYQWNYGPSADGTVYRSEISITLTD